MLQTKTSQSLVKSEIRHYFIRLTISNITMLIESFKTIVVDCPEIACLLEVCTIFCRYEVFTWSGSDSKVIFSEMISFETHAECNKIIDN